MMKALHYDGPNKTIVKEIAMPKMEHPDDIIVRVTTACICGSDLHVRIAKGHKVRLT